MGDGPEVTFGADRPRIDFETSAELRWTTEKAVRVVISDGTTTILDTDDDPSGLSGTLDVTPDKTTIYELTATAEDGADTRASVEIVVDPVIDSFGSDATKAYVVGAEVELHWTTRGAEALAITSPEGVEFEVPVAELEEGSASLPVGASGRFTLTATRGKGEASMDHEVHLGEAPRIVALSASPEAISVGLSQSTVTVQWEVEDATSISLERGQGGEAIDLSGRSPTADSVDVRLSEATTLVFTATNDAGVTYTLRARNLAGASISDTVAITIGSPIINSFTANADRYAPGEAIEFAWAVEGGTLLRILDGDGAAVCTKTGGREIRENGCQVSAPATSGMHLYTLELTNGLDQMIAVTIIVQVSDGPEITAFAAAPSTLSQGEEVTFSWAVSSDAAGVAPTLIIEDDAGVPLHVPGLNDTPHGGTASVVMTEAGQRTFTLRAFTPGTMADAATADVNVIAAPVVASFTADPTEVSNGQSTTLTWSTQHGVEGSLFLVDSSGQTQLIAPLDATAVASGSQVVTPSGSQSTATYRLVVANVLGAEVQEEVVVSVVTSSVITSFNASPATVAPGGTVTLDWVTTQGDVTLSPYVHEPAEELTPQAPFSDISQTGTPVDLDTPQCHGGQNPLDEGCATIHFPAGFTFPFDGVERTAVDVYANGFASFDVGRFASDSNVVADLPNPARDYVHIAPYWVDLTLADNTNGGMFYEFKSDHAGDRLVVQWNRGHDKEDYNPSDLTFQVVLWENGSFDLRYGVTSIGVNPDFDAWAGVIGFQDTDAGNSHMILPRWGTFFPKGLGHRTWRYFEKPQPASGTTTITIDKTTIFTLCASLPAGRQCESRTVVVN